MIYKTTDFRKNLKILIEGKPYIIIESKHTNPGKGSAFVRCRLKNLETGLMLERTYKAGVETFESPDLEQREMSFMYADGEGFHFMDQNNYESVCLTHDQVGDSKDYLQEGINITILYFNGRPISLDLPNFVNLVVKETDPGMRGDTATGGQKKAIMDTGLQINVPLFIEIGEKLKIDTRTGEYIERFKG